MHDFSMDRDGHAMNNHMIQADIVNQPLIGISTVPSLEIPQTPRQSPERAFSGRSLRIAMIVYAHIAVIAS
jgi:hypothetical protein